MIDDERIIACRSKLRIERSAESLALQPGGDVVYRFAEDADITIVT